MKRLLFLSLLLALTAAILDPGSTGAQTTDAARTLQLINQARAKAGLGPLALNAQLAAAAQAHADDMLRKGVGIGHYGSDGSTPRSRAVRAGYGAYSFGLYVGENWVGYDTVDVGFNWWMGDPPHRQNILRPEYREIGIGVARSAGGDMVLVTDFGAQPNVLPVFFAGTGSKVTLTLSNEDLVPDGDGPGVIGRAVQVDVSPNAELSQAVSFPYSRSISYSSPDGRPVVALYVRFRDAQGRTAVSHAASAGQMVVPVSAPRAAAVSPSATRTRAPRPTATKTARPSATSTATTLPTQPPTPTWTSTLTPTIRPTVTALARRLTPTLGAAPEEALGVSPVPLLGFAFLGGSALSAVMALAIALRRKPR